MKILYIVLLACLVFGLSIIGGQKYRIMCLTTLAVGGLVNANFFNATSYSIMCFGLPFGIDSVIYTLYVYCVIVALLFYNKKQAYAMGLSGILAISFSATMQLIADLLSGVSLNVAFNTFISFVLSIIGTLITLVVIIELCNKLKQKINNYLVMIIALVISTIVNSFIYYGMFAIITNNFSDIWQLILASVIGKTIATIMAMLAFFAINKLNADKIIDN